MKTTLKTAAGLGLAAMRQLAGVGPAGFSSAAKLELAASRSGRIVLHILCAWRDRRFAWHWSGIAREFTPA